MSLISVLDFSIFFIGMKCFFSPQNHEHMQMCYKILALKEHFIFFHKIARCFIKNPLLLKSNKIWLLLSQGIIEVYKTFTIKILKPPFSLFHSGVRWWHFYTLWAWTLFCVDTVAPQHKVKQEHIATFPHFESLSA